MKWRGMQNKSRARGCGLVAIPATRAALCPSCKHQWRRVRHGGLRFSRVIYTFRTKKTEREVVCMRPGKYLRVLQLFLPLLLAEAAPLSVMAQAYPPNGPAIPAVTLNGSAPTQEPPPNPPDQQSQWNMELVGHSDLQGRSAYQPIIINQDGREIAYVGHHTGTAMNPL